MPEINVPKPARPLGITMLSALLGASALTLLVVTLMHHEAGLAGFGRLVTVVTFVLIAVGLWMVHNNARVFLFFLLVSDVIGCLMALFLYALRQSQYRLAVFLVVQLCIAAALVWYLQSPGIKKAFGGLNPWPTTVKMLVLTIFTVLLAFPFYWMVIATFKRNVDLYAMENNPFIFNMPPTLENLRLLFQETGFVRWLGNTA
ncbi:MAG TPA: hypothetical protein VLA83_13300, partial [Candidatus Binatia bacterium]|nr:hypothetical protein [Candidatus Binatia bacterium]